MSRLIYWLLILVTAAALRPAPGWALTCGADDGDGPGRIDNGVWQYRMEHSPMNGDRTRLLRKVAAAYADGGQVAVGRAGSGRVRMAPADPRAGAAAEAAADTPMKLDYDLDQRRRTDTLRGDPDTANVAWFESAHPPADAAAARGRSGRGWHRNESGADGVIPKPDAWAMLMAGLLGMCAVVRRRIFPI